MRIKKKGFSRPSVPASGLLLAALLAIGASSCSDLPADGSTRSLAASRPSVRDYSPGDPASPYGVNIPIVDLQDDSRAWQIIGQMAAAGAMYIRLDAYWGTLQPGGPGYLDATAAGALRSAVSKTLAFQMIPVVVVQGVPNWAITYSAGSPAISNYTGAPTDDHLGDWQSFLSLLVNDSGLSSVTLWAIQNEPNSRMDVVQGASRLDTYKKLVQYAATPIHTAGKKLLGPETIGALGVADPTSGNKLGAAWLADAMRSVGSLVDVITVHDYQEQSIDIEADMKILADSAGGNRDLWLTEAATAYTTPTSSQQRIHVREVLQRMSDAHTRGSDPTQPPRNPYWVKTFWWDASSAVASDTRGLLDGSLAPKEAYYCYRGIARPSLGMPAYCFNYGP